MSTTGIASLSAPLGGRRCTGLSLDGQRDLEPRAASEVDHGVNISAVKARSCTANRESEPDTDDVAFRAAALKFLEQALRVAGRKPGPVIRDHQ
jgi:hypothetical protein